ncbi:MAG: TetR/AcrR family transcriptional regulator [Candidatus Phaeomarinobacter sp.]
MPRPTKKSERRAQILDAFERAVSRYGLDGATLDRVSEEAGLARALIRHNVGNREDLIEAFTKRFMENSDAAMASMVDHLPTEKPSTAMVNWLFQPGSSDTQLILASSALIMAGAHDRQLAKRMREWTDAFIARIEGVVKQDYPKASREARRAVATGISGIYFNSQSLAPLGVDTALRTRSHDAALRLLHTLDG